MSSYQSTGPRFPNRFSAPPWQPHTGANTPSPALSCRDISHFSQLEGVSGPGSTDTHDTNPADRSPSEAKLPAPSGDGASSAGPSSAPAFPTGTAAPPRYPPSREQTPHRETPDEIDPDRTYRRGPVYSSAVPTAAVRMLGLTTHMGTLRLETAALGIISALGQISQQHHALREQQLRKQLLQEQQNPNPQQLPLFTTGDGAPAATEDVPPSRYQYVNAYSGREHIVERRPGTIVKSIQGIAEDLYQCIYKRLPPEQDPLTDPAFRRVYERAVKAMRRLNAREPSAGASNAKASNVKAAPTEGNADETANHKATPNQHHSLQRPSQRRPLVERIGPAVPHANKLVRDRNGQRWQVHPALLKGNPQTARAVRTAGPEPRVHEAEPTLDPLRAAEELHAHRETLHQQFTAGWKSQVRQGTWTAPVPREARRSQAHIATQGSDYPSFMSLGRWRTDEIRRRHPDSAVTVPWIIADIDGPDRYTSYQHAQTLCTLLKRYGVDPAHIQVAYTGGRGFHVWIPHGLVGCPVYQDAEATQVLIRQFFDRLCEGHPELRQVIDNMAMRPCQPIRMIGSKGPNGRRCVGTTADIFMEEHPLVLFGHSDAGHYDGFTLPKPETVPYSPSLGSLLLHKEVLFTAQPVHTRVQDALRGDRVLHLPALQSTRNPQVESPITVNSYCWKPYFSRPPPFVDPGAFRGPLRPEDGPVQAAGEPGHTDQGIIGRLMCPVAESEPWGEAIDVPYTGRNMAAFLMGLYVTSHPDAATRRIQALCRRRNGTGMPVGEGLGRNLATSPAGGDGYAASDAPHDRPSVDEPSVETPSAKALLRTWNQVVCEPALPEAELMATLTSAQRYTIGRRR